MTQSALTDLTATEARERMARGDILAEAYTKACLDQIEARDGAVEAWACLDPGHALEQARALDKQRASGASIGALHGLPVGIKDIIDTADMPTQNGSALFKGYQPAKDATCVAVLRAAGAVVIGKTVTTELANTTPNKTRNPHNPAHTPGGSSSGSAAGVAAKMIPLGLGTQTGGSVIRPGSFCGVHAMKPTLGLISRSGVTLQSHTLDTVGVYGRSLADLALITDALSQYDPTDSVSYERGRGTISETLGAGVTGKPSLGFFRSPAWDQGEPAAKAALEAFVARLGACVSDVEIPALDSIIQHHANVMGAENSGYYGPLLARNPEGVSPGLTERLRNAERVLGGDYVRSLAARDVLYAEVERVLGKHSVLVTLPSCGPAPKGLASTGNAVFNAMWTYLGVPCVTLPLMTVDGMPCGVQLIAKRRDEGRLLAVARWVEDQVAERGVMR
jgi:Asp-tRNA(Asn)/Glu-tRNA(Gln) amidotransferase A subunit family amidase